MNVFGGKKWLRWAPVAVWAALAGCAPVPLNQVEASFQVRGHVTFSSAPSSPVSYRILALLTEVANRATVSLIDAQKGDTVSSSVTDERGGFVLKFSNFSPASGAPYTLEAVKGLSVGGKTNRPGAAAVRVRTLLFWNSGWQSLTNSLPGAGISVSPATTAIATIASLKQSANQAVDLTKLIGKVTGSSFNESGTDLSGTADFDPVLKLVDSALMLDQDPVAAIGYDSARGTYRLASGVPLGVGVEPAIPTPGQVLTVRGINFDPTVGRSVFWFGSVPAATWSVAVDRGSATVTVPANAYSAPFTLQQSGGLVQTLHPFLKLRGTVGTLAGNGINQTRDGRGATAGFSYLSALVIGPTGTLYVIDTYVTPRAYLIRKITPAGEVSLLAGSPRCTDAEITADPERCNADGVGSAARFVQIEHLAIDQGGAYLYASDEYMGRIRKIDVSSGAVTTLRNSAGTPVQLSVPTGVGLDSAGNTYAFEYTNRRIQKISPAGVVSTAVTGLKQSFGLRMLPDGSGFLLGYEPAGGLAKLTPAGPGLTWAPIPGAESQFTFPARLDIDPRNGDLYIAEGGRYRVRKVSASGVASVVAGSISDLRDGRIADALFMEPGGITVDGDGIIYVADRRWAGSASVGAIRVITP